MNDLDIRLRADGERWRAAQPPPPRPSASVDTRGGERRRLLPLLAAAVTVTVLAGVVAVLAQVQRSGPRWQAGAAPAGFVAHVFGPVEEPDAPDCYRGLFAVAANPRGGAYVSEDPCGPGAGDERPPRTFPPFRVDVLQPDGHVRVVSTPGSASASRGAMQVRVAGPDGTLYAYGGPHAQLFTWGPRAGWKPISAPQSDGLTSHTGDGGPLREATLEPVGGAAFGPDGSLYLAEPYAVRRVDPSGTITTVAGTNAQDPGSTGYWGGRGRYGADSGPPVTAPSRADTTPLPWLRGIAVDADGTLWLVGTTTIYTVRRGILRLELSPKFGRTTTAGRILPFGPRVGRGWECCYGGALNGAALSPDGSSLYVLDRGTRRLLRLDLRRRTLGLVAGQPVTSAQPLPSDDGRGQFGPSGRRLVRATDVVLPGGGDGVPPSSIAFTADGDLLINAGTRGLLRLGKPETLPAR